MITDLRRQKRIGAIIQVRRKGIEWGWKNHSEIMPEVLIRLAEIDKLKVENRKESKEAIRIRGKRFHQIHKNELKYKLDKNLTTIIATSLKGKKAERKWENLVGYSVEDLIAHLEKQFDDKMNWQNYGSYWWIDHIKAKSLFKYENPEDKEFKNCWALENLQPMEKIANIKKGNHY